MERLIYAARASRLAGVSALALMLAASSAAAQSALPTGGSVTSGGASIGVAGSAMTVTQSSQRAIVNWNSFSIGQRASVTFAQPNANSAILNRVTGTASTAIAGQLNANGQVFLVNPNGIAITPTGAVRVGGGFVGSTLGISDGDFSNGYLNFKGGGASGPVSIAGSISTSPGGFVGVIGSTVSVSGDIAVPLGKVALGSGEAAALDLTGDNFLRVAAPTGATTSDGRGLVDVSGKVRAAGGAIVVKAATAADAVRNAINIPGSLAASSARASGGSIILGGGPGGDVNISGRVAASGRGRGGSVKIMGHNVNLNQAKVVANGKTGAGGAVTITSHNAVALTATQVSANGATRGGDIRIGGDFHGASDVLAAQQTTIDAASTLSANATVAGDGGTVAVWSSALTDFAGYISARGGPNGGDGGFAEVSASPLNHGVLAYSGLADLRAPEGQTGALLLDPYDITISVGATTNIATSGSTTYTSSNTPSVLNNTQLGNQLGLSNVTVTTGAVGSPGGEAGNITVTAGVTWASTNTLTLNAAGYIHLDASLDATGGGSVTMTATNEVYQQAGFPITANNLSATSTAGPVVLTAFNTISGSISGSGATGFSFGNDGNISVGGITATTGSTALLAYAGSITQTAPISAPALYVDAVLGNVTLTNTGNNIGTLAGTVGLLRGGGFGTYAYEGANASTTIGTVTYNTSETSGDLIVPVTSPPGIVAGAVTVANLVGALVLDQPVTANNPTGNVVLAASGAFSNNVGSTAITTAGGIWQVYSASPTATGENFNGLDSGNTAVWDTSFGGTVTATGDRYIFAFQPTITITSGNLGKTYGNDVTPTVATDYTITGLQPADPTGAYTADTAAAVYSGAPSVTSLGSPASASVAGSPYAVTVAAGSFAVTDGYLLALTSTGKLTVSPISLTWSVADANSTYGTLATLGAATLNGVLAGDTVTPTVGIFSGATLVALTAKTPVGSYSEQVTAINNTNYTLATSGNTPGALTISPKALTWSVADANSIYGTLATLGAATLTGVVAGDTVTPTVGAFSGATPVALTAKTSVGAYSEQVTAINNANYTLAVSGNTPGVLTISPLALTWSVANANSTYGTLAAVGAATLTGVLAGDTVTPTVGVFSGASPITLAAKTPVGTYSEQVTAISNANYTLAATGNTPGVLTISPLAITYAVANANSTYGTLATVGAATLTGVLAGDIVTPTVGVFSGASPITLAAKTPVGTYSEQVTAISNANYTLAATGNTPGALTISPLAITWAVANASSTYGTVATPGATTLTGVLAGDTVTPTVGVFSGASPIILAAKTPVGAYSEQVTAINNANYTLAATGNTPGVLTISPLAITYAVANANSTYGTLATVGATTLTGVLAGDTVTSTVGVFSGATPVTLTAKTPVGIYSEQVTAISNPNYTLAATGNTPGALTISPLAITYAVADSFSLFGSTPVLGATSLSGVLPGDAVTPTTAAFSGVTPVALSRALAPGVYAERVTALSDPNYVIAAAGNSPGALRVYVPTDPGQVPGIINWTPPASGGDIDLGGFELQLPALPSSCESANLPDPNRFSDPKAALEALSKAMEKLFEVCQNLTPSTIADALDAYAARLEVLAPRLPPQLRNLPQIIHKAAQDIRAARTPGEAVKAVVVAIGEVHKALALLRAEDPVFGRVRATADRTVDATLDAARVSLLKAAGL